MNKTVPVLLICFNRPDFVSLRIKELIDQVPVLIVSIDGPRPNYKEDLIANQMIKEICNKFNVKYIERKSNVGLYDNFFDSINDVLINYNNIIVLEDDISVNSDFYQIMSEGIHKELRSPYCMINAFSPIYSNNNFINQFLTNTWIKSSYSTTWGVAFSKNFFECLQKFRNMDNKSVDDIKKDLQKSAFWCALSARKKNIWVKRFKQHSYDYHLQATIWASNCFLLTPKFSLVKNEGLGDYRAVHTKLPPPWWLKNHGFTNMKFIQKVFESNLRIFIASSTLAGDSLFTKRARSVGIRTFIKLVLKKIKFYRS
jgi:hypothetical protein